MIKDNDDDSEEGKKDEEFSHRSLSLIFIFIAIPYKFSDYLQIIKNE